VHGQEQPVTLGGRTVTLYPLFHPAAALYTPTMLEVLERDFARLPELLGTRDAGSEPVVEMPTHQAPEDTELGAPRRQPVQLGLF
jgi:DNA polymerase